jgi:hypothetical protein
MGMWGMWPLTWPTPSTRLGVVVACVVIFVPAVDVAIDMACVVALVDAAYAVNAAGCRCPPSTWPLTWLVSSPSSTRLGADVAVDAAGSRRGR